MDFNRHVTAGRLAELFGADQVPTDAYLRTMGWRRVAEAEYDLLAEETRRYLDAYAEGVNAYLEGKSATEVSLEYAVLAATNSEYEIEPWSAVDSLAWLKAMAWDLAGNMHDEIARASLLARGLPREQVEELYPAYRRATPPSSPAAGSATESSSSTPTRRSSATRTLPTSPPPLRCARWPGCRNRWKRSRALSVLPPPTWAPTLGWCPASTLPQGCRCSPTTPTWAR